MIRALSASLLVLATLSVARADLAVYQAGGKKPEPAPADARRKIIAELDADGEKATDHLSNKQAGAALTPQQRILDNIDELLKQQDPTPPPPRSQNPPPPASKSPKEQKPSATPQEKPQPQQSAESKPMPAPASPKPATDSNKRGQSAERPQKPNQDPKGGEWDTRKGRAVEIDALTRDRLIRNYEEVPRAYYRSVAENARRNDAD